jgi:transitional endoplasmic reticulum ATPase
MTDDGANKPDLSYNLGKLLGEGLLSNLGDLLERLDAMAQANEGADGSPNVERGGGVRYATTNTGASRAGTRSVSAPSSMPRAGGVGGAAPAGARPTGTPTSSGYRPKRPAAAPVSYAHIGGLDKEIQRIREMVELPLRYPQVFERLGIRPPKGVLLYGAPGSGKTLIARAVAEETGAYFIVVNGPEIIDKLYGQSEGALRRVFEDAKAHAPSIVFIDEIDAIAPKRSQVQGEVEKRVVAQLLTLLDGLTDRGEVVVIGATNLPDHIDPALRRPGRFDREIALPVPDRVGREAILRIHAQTMPLAADVDLAQLAAVTHGYVGADLAALCREAAMAALRRFLPAGLSADADLTAESLADLIVNARDFEGALAMLHPSATREVYVEIPDATWDDIGGLETAKTALRQAVELPLLYPELFAQAKLQPPRGILLSGQPGTGKTLLAKAVARETNVNFISVQGPELLNKWVGESERAVRDLFRIARQAAPCVLFFDEFDALARARTGVDPAAERVVAQLLTEMDGIEDARGVLILAATNRPDLIDPALRRPGRLDLHIDIGLPDGDARAAIFAIHLRERPVDPTLSPAILAASADGWSGAAIAEWCRRAALRAVTRAIANGESVLITADDFAAALEAAGWES